jgi:glycosyltransferase involved in cell wall biosynthesis
MHVTLFKPGSAPIPPELYGGTERLIYWLGKALITLGHQVTLIAHPQSHIPGAELIGWEDTDLQKGLRLVPDSTDIIHLFDLEKPSAQKPFLITINGNGAGPRHFHPNSVFVSKSHAANHGSAHFVHNGIDPADYVFSETRQDYAVFLAKARWQAKNFAGALRVAQKAGLELRVLGSRNWPFGLQRLLPPSLCRGARYYGMLGGREKIEILSRARCLILPVRWQEPFGIAYTEALISGAYVCGTPYGSQPEIVTAETGVLSARADDLADAARNPQRFSPAACRERVLRGGFTHMDMARKYLMYYEKILTRGSLLEKGESPAATLSGFNPRELLPWQN